MTLQGQVVSQHVLQIPTKMEILDSIDIVFNIAEQIVNLVRASNVLLVCIESPTFSSASSRSKQLSMLFGSILQGLNLPYLVCGATVLKKFATGSGSHSKEEKKLVMLNAWKKSDLGSYLDTETKLLFSIPKPAAQRKRAMEDLADSYWLAKYGVDKVRRAIGSLTNEEDVRAVVFVHFGKRNPKIVSTSMVTHV